MRIALATVGTTGDVRPFAALAEALVARDHVVTAVTWPVHRSALALPGVEVRVAGPHADPARIAQVAADAAARGPMDQVAVLRDFHLADGEAHARQLREALAGHDVVLLHGIHVLAHAAVLDVGVPWATVAFDPVLQPTAELPPPGMPNLGPANRLLWSVLDRTLARTGRPADDILDRAGSDQRSLPLFRARSPGLHLLACSPAIARIPGDLPPTTHVTGAWVPSGPPYTLPETLAAFLEDGAPPVVVTFGSMSGVDAGALRGALERVLDGGRRIVVQGGAGIASPNLLETGAVDHRALLPRASVVVHHGGAGTVHAAVTAGVPSVVVPHIGDQRYWAARLHHLGVAPAPLEVRRLDAARLAESILIAAADRELHERAANLGEVVGRERGVASAVGLLEQYVAAT